MSEETNNSIPYTVFIPQKIAEAGKTYLRERGYSLKMGSGISVDALKKDIADCDAVLARTEPYPAEVLEAAPKLKVIARHGVGVDNIDIEKATELGIYVTNAPESNANSVAEHAMLLMLGALRYCVKCNSEMRRGNFAIRDQVYGYDIEGKTLGVLGLGRIGSRVARKASAGFNMNVMGCDPYISPANIPAEVEKLVEWDYLFQNADIITIHIPAKTETKNLVGAKEFSMMKETAFLINAARGHILDEQALISALKEKSIAGAGLDVYKQEPLPADHPLLSFDNVFLTPHNATLTKECMDRMALHAAQGIDEVLSGKKPTWPVNNPKVNNPKNRRSN